MSTPPVNAPLILTLRFDEASFARFDAERRRHFPPARNVVPAHLILFHQLPSESHNQITEALAAIAARQASFAMAVRSVRFLGQGTAYAINSPELERLRARMATRWSADLTRQDAHGFRPHVTIQNKVAPAAAKAFFAALSATFAPFEIVATGLLLWHYCGGPWEPAGEYDFSVRVRSATASEAERRS